MAKNIGKIFEDNIKKSIPDYAKYYRLHDSAQSFGGGNLRFSSKNPFDFFIWDSLNKFLYTLELKSVKGKSISFERNLGDKGIIHYHQIYGLNEWNKYEGVISGFIIEFRDYETTIFINIKDFLKLIDNISKKSFNLNDLKENDINYIVIEQRKLRTNYRYDIDCLFSVINNSKK